MGKAVIFANVEQESKAAIETVAGVTGDRRSTTGLIDTFGHLCGIELAKLKAKHGEDLPHLELRRIEFAPVKAAAKRA